MQQIKKRRPLYVVQDTDELLLKEDEARYLKGYRINFNINSNISTGTSNESGQGGNFGIGTPIQSNKEAAPDLILPAGKNKCIGSYECQELNEMYWFNWNEHSLHGIYRLSGDDLKSEIVYMGSCLNFSIDPKFSLDNRISIHVVYDVNGEGDRTVKSIYLKFCDGFNWHRWIDVLPAIATAGFNSDIYPYYLPVTPHKNKCELINWAVTPPFKCPQVNLIPYSIKDVGKNNNMRNKSIQFAYQFIYRDGRSSTFSPYSVNVFVNPGGCADLNTNNPRCATLKIESGNANVEKIRIFFRNCGGTFYLYETIDKYKKCEEGEFYQRTIGLTGYDVNDNTFIYTYCGDKECAIFSIEDSTRVQTDMPIVSFALTPVGDVVVLGNNLYGYDNFDCKVLDNISIDVIPPNSVTASCAPKNVTIRAYTTVKGVPICRITKGTDDLPDGRLALPRGFATNYGGNSIDYPCPDGDILNGKGLIGYLAGTPFAVIGVQYRVDKLGVMEKVGILNWYDPSVQEGVRQTFRDGGYYVQRYEFVVESGNYLFRVASQKASLTDVDYQKTSTFIYGSGNVNGVTNGFMVDNADFTRKELLIEACGKDIDTFFDKNKLVLDFEPPFLINVNREKWFQGYITDTDEVDKRGIELLQYIVNEGFPETIRSGRYTDHNGFYFTSVQRGGANNAEVFFWGEYECQPYTRNNAMFITRTGTRPRGQKGFTQNISIKDKKGIYNICNEVRVKGKIVDEQGVGIPGISVVVTRGGATSTNGSGEFTLKVHRGNVRGEGELDYLLFTSLGGCSLVTADCNCLPMKKYIQPLSCSCPGEVGYTIDNLVLKYISTANKGLKGGGRYGISVVGDDGAGRQTFANNIAYVDIPTFLETGIFSPSTLKWKITEDFQLPYFIKYISFYITSNLNFDSYIQWVGDKISFINAKGEEVTTSDEAIRTKIIIQSLLDFNKENNFATTVGYQFVAGDILRIYDDGDGNLFNVNANNSFLDYPILGTNFNESTAGDSSGTNPGVVDGKSFIITYDKRLDKLKDKCSFWIEILRPHQCQDKELYHEICGTYPIENGKIMNGVKDGVLETWDTYYQTRSIRPTDCAAKTINHPFESNSITDYWGSGCDSKGRITAIDTQATQEWYGDDIIISDVFVNEGRVNGLGTFRVKNRKNFEGQEFGAIVSMHAEQGIIIFICQNDWFVTDYNMKYLKANASGFVLATQDKISDPHQKKGANYGCEFEDNSSIVYDDGIVVWADRKNSNVVACDYINAADVAIIQNKGYFIQKFNEVIKFNNSLSPQDYLPNLIEIVGGKNVKYGEYLISFRPRRGLSEDANDYFNNEREVRIDHQETFSYSLSEQRWMRYEHFVPEHYGALRHSSSGKEMITFMNGKPYFHNSNSITDFNTFYGIQGDQIISIIENFDPSKIKIFQSIILESSGLGYFADMIFTSEPNSFSYIPTSHWKKRKGIYYATILTDMNSYDRDNKIFRSKLFDGKVMDGTYIYIRLVRDTNNRSLYNELNNIWTRITGSEPSEK